MGKKKTTTKETAQATTKPNVPAWLEAPFQDYAARVQRFGQMDPRLLVPGASPLQSMAFRRAMMLNGGRGMPQQPNELSLMQPDQESPMLGFFPGNGVY